MRKVDCLIVGAGAAGMMCAAEAGRRGRSVLLVDHAKAPGEKIRISGGGRCNFTNLRTAPENFLSANPRFCISALRRYTQRDFISLVERHGIAYHEKTLGQLFCDDSSKQIVEMLTTELRQAEVRLELSTSVASIARLGSGYRVELSSGSVEAASLVIATGGKSIPKMGATGFAYGVAEQFGIKVMPTRPGLVPLTFDPDTLERLKPLSGISVEAEVACGKTRFAEGLLFTHRGLSGPSILQISSYWREGEEIRIDLAPGTDASEVVLKAKADNPKQAVQTALASVLPKRLAVAIAEEAGTVRPLGDTGDKALRALGERVNRWRVKPSGSEGYRTAEVTLGGIDTASLDQKTMEAKAIPGLYFIGEAVDVTGWLGGYNFQWAWSSGWSAGQAV
ncbi:NAD(P)/FAD-dependent oxidoreductase [Nisaea acidiphila]|uniref:NAD(P)/FAD-dependent oxidoreductase n=1 Tax=Nisaea acidiphila TaxID=1862145 RepID=A0A9J7AQ61_9PROT|nr:NAD(P)/FAD-dependent oxidoreductase [Nisaea acidiphila]UUX49367.1 NAD(P)/FAD-dependent oxidoreductase [Nisaea acidiphila]